MGNPVAENRTFAAFLNAAPEFAGDEVASWSKPKEDPPDVFCVTKTGRRIGVELRGWLDEDQMSQARGMEAIQQSILEAIEPEPPNDRKHIQIAWLHPVPRARVKPAHAAAFRAELVNLIRAVDSRWDREPRRGLVGFRMQGCPYSEDSMIDALLKGLEAKIQKYGAPPSGLDEFYLVVHYDEARAYNSPVEMPWFKFADAARSAADFIGDDPGAFDRIFLFVPDNGAQQVFRLYPRQGQN